MKLTQCQYYSTNFVIFLLFLLSMYCVYNPKPKLLILHSYDIDYDWVLQMNDGIQRVTKMHPLKTRYHYMNLKNKFTEFDKKVAQDTALNLINNFNPDVMIIADDAAQELIGKQFINKEDVSIVFCGVNGEVDKYGYDKAFNVTGVYERKPLKAIKETLMLIANTKGFEFDGDKNVDGKIPRVVWLTDMSDSVTQEIKYLNAFDWRPLYWLQPLRAFNLFEWQENVFTANETSDLILVSDYRELRNHDGSKEDVKPNKLIQWTERSSTNPVLCMSLVNVKDGGSLSVFNSGYEQGEVAATMATEIIHGKKTTDIKRVVSTQFITAVRESSNNKNLPDIYRAFSEATNNTYKEKDKD